MSFDRKEIDNAVVTERMFGTRVVRSITYDSPISARENVRRAYQKKALWMPNRSDMQWFCPSIIPDNVARAFIIEEGHYDGPVGGDDMFGIYWEYVPSAHGSIVRPGNPTLTDPSQWREVIKFPDIDSWDWEGSAKKNNEWLKNNEKYMNLCIFTGWFERIISWMDFGPAAYALMNRKTKDYVKEMMEAITDLWIRIVDKADQYYGHNIDGFAFHDDWGSQDRGFFRESQVMEMIVPYMKKVVDHCHELGYTTELHSCGRLDKIVQCIPAAGWGSWNCMSINDFPTDFALYGDKLIISVTPEDAPEDAPVEEHLAAAARFVEAFGDPERPIFIDRAPQTREFTDEVYRLSRIKYDP